MCRGALGAGFAFGNGLNDAVCSNESFLRMIAIYQSSHIRHTKFGHNIACTPLLRAGEYDLTYLTLPTVGAIFGR
jgi:hypothetical protein